MHATFCETHWSRLGNNYHFVLWLIKIMTFQKLILLSHNLSYTNSFQYTLNMYRDYVISFGN